MQTNRRPKNDEKNRPAFEKRLGAIRVAIWANTSPANETWWNVSIVRRYRDGEEWKEANTFNGLADLALVKEGVALAAAWIHAQEIQPASFDL